MGNPLLKQYQAGREPIIPRTRHGRWTVHRGRHADRPAGEVSLFTFNLHAPEFSGLAQDGTLLQQLRDLLLQDAQLLQRLRHPRLLQVVEPLQQSKDCWVFCAKPIVLSLKQLLGAPREASPYPQQRQQQQLLLPLLQGTAGGYVPPDGMSIGDPTSSNITSLSSSSSKREQQKRFRDAAAARELLWRAPPSLLEVKCGLLDLAEALSFLHRSARLLHLNIHPEAVFIDADGRWKLGGFFFAQQMQQDSDTANCSFSFRGVSAGVALCPPLMYTAPELPLGHPVSASAAADVFSFSLLAAECLGASPHLLSCRDGEVELHQQQCHSLSPLRPSVFSADSLFHQGAAAAAAETAAAAEAAAAEAGLLQLLSRGLSVAPEDRPPIEAFLSNSCLLSTETRALRFLSSLHEKQQQQQQQFLVGLLPLLQQQQLLQQPRLLRLHVLEPLLSSLKYATLLPALLPNVFFCLKKLNDVDYFREAAWPRMQPLLTAKEIQVEAVVCLVEEFRLLVENSTQQTKTNDLLPFLLKCLDIQASEIQRAALVAVRESLNLFDYTTQRTLLLPRLLSLISNAETSAVRLEGLKGLATMVTALDRVAIEAQILPVIEQVTKADRSPAVCMQVGLTLSSLSSGLSLPTNAEKVLPIFFSLLFEDGLSLEEYRRIDAEVKRILKKGSMQITIPPSYCSFFVLFGHVFILHVSKKSVFAKKRIVDDDRREHFRNKALQKRKNEMEQQSAVQAALPSPPVAAASEGPFVRAVSFEYVLADASSSSSLPVSVHFNAPPPPPPRGPPRAATNLSTTKLQQQRRQQQQAGEFGELFASLSTRLAHASIAAKPASSNSSSKLVQPLEAKSADLETILAAASAAVPKSNASSFDAFAELLNSPTQSRASFVNDSKGRGVGVPFEDPFAGLGLPTGKGPPGGPPPLLCGGEPPGAPNKNPIGATTCSSTSDLDPFAGLGGSVGSSGASSSRLGVQQQQQQQQQVSEEADPFACISGVFGNGAAAASDPFTGLRGQNPLSAKTTKNPKP
ncbi:hypothetical protein Esti_003951 [Eimeria stiedai]